MGFLDGFLGGVVTQRNRIEDQNRQDAADSQQRESAVLSHLMTSDDPEIKSLAVAGMLDSTSPKKSKKGFSGWLGEMQNNPNMDRIRALVAHDQAVGHLVSPVAAHAAGTMTAMGDPASAAALTTAHAAAQQESSATPGTANGQPETPGIEGMPTPTPPPAIASPKPTAAEGGAAMSANSPTEIGSAPPAPATGGAGPTAAAPSMPGAPGVAATPAAVMGRSTPLPATPGGPPASAVKPGVSPGAVMGQPEKPGVGPLSPRGDVFRSPETQARVSKVASAQGDVEGLTAGLKAAGFNDAEIKAQLQLHYGRGTGAGMAPSSVKGEAPDANGKFSPTFAILNKVTHQYEDSDGQPIPGFRPMGGASQHYGVALEAASQRMFGGSYGSLSQAQQAQAQTEVEKTVGRTATARGEGANAAKLDAPIGVANALRYGVPANTTLRQLQERVPLAQADQDKIHGVSTLEGTLGNVEELLPKVFPDVAPGILGRLKTGLTLFAKSAGRDEDLTKLNSEIASTMAGIVRLNGITQRLNVKELDLAQKQMIDTSALHGDTLESAQAKMEILRDLIKRVQVGPTSQAAPGTAGAIGAPPPGPTGSQMAPGGTGAAAPAGPGMQMVNGKLYKDGKPY